MPLELKCEICSKPFIVRAYRKGTARFCSRRCHDISQMKRPTLVCSECKQPKDENDFYLDRSRPRGRVSRCKVCYKKQAALNELKPWRKLSHYREQSKRRKMVWALTEEQFLQFWQQPCTYCGQGIATIGLDRVDSSKGYTMDNVVSCCALCNTMKTDMPVEEFIEHCRRIVWTSGHKLLWKQANAAIALDGRNL